MDPRPTQDFRRMPVRPFCYTTQMLFSAVLQGDGILINIKPCLSVANKRSLGKKTGPFR